MLTLPNSLEVAMELLGERRFAEFGIRCAGLIYEKRTTYGLRRDLREPFEAPKAKIPITIRKLSVEDVSALCPDNQTAINRKERVELATRRAHYRADIAQCYVAIDQRNGTPCYFQWLMGPEQNAKIQAFFPRRWFPLLNDDEALLENAYTPAGYRGNGIMPAAMAQIAERAADLGCRYVHTFVEKTNLPSLKGCKRSGFAPYLTRDEFRLALGTLKRRRFSIVPDGLRI